MARKNIKSTNQLVEKDGICWLVADNSGVRHVARIKMLRASVMSMAPNKCIEHLEYAFTAFANLGTRVSDMTGRI